MESKIVMNFDLTQWRKGIFLVSAVSLVFLLNACSERATAYPPEIKAKNLTENDWLLGAPNDEERFRLLQKYLRGFDQPMWEVGERYQIMYDALVLENFDLARYQWKKIRTTIENGILKRPGRGKNAGPILLDNTWGIVNESYKSGDINKAWEGFDMARNACLGCHAVEVANGQSAVFVNRQPLFTNTAPPYQTVKND